MVPGLTTCNMDLAKKLGKTEQLNLKESTFKEKSAAEDAMSGLMEAFTRATLWTACSTVTACITSLSQRRLTRGSLRKISLKEKASSLLRTVGSTTAILKLVKKTVKELWCK